MAAPQGAPWLLVASYTLSLLLDVLRAREILTPFERGGRDKASELAILEVFRVRFILGILLQKRKQALCNMYNKRRPIVRTYSLPEQFLNLHTESAWTAFYRQGKGHRFGNDGRTWFRASSSGFEGWD
ncbi:hypothetical protein DFP72DRAFT_844418 [Ephemerocybe angulata]|uniref:Uncharacterized protein n=1 Tax=Ephemerocybe angulata TaxID=980116 RepID=A0A8H6MBK3_9AGAR|nr:hypothetical protein DFP72DRAFT_844418 [Tulosesus angulatus]